ncbi:MAG: hypothetical protein HY040_17320 [Planctomycetes bacterium]|nr:hypothetical protein [Planctomycetota bacterium]
MDILADIKIQAELRRAWLESNPGQTEAHEEGGFVLKSNDGTLLVERWAKGTQNEIIVPNHDGGVRAGMPIIATFHTHPNTGVDFQQDPSPTDIRAVHDDPHLGGACYEGEIVISEKKLYRILKDGTVDILGDTKTLLGIP